MSREKTGKEIPCFNCGKPVYKCAGYLARGYTRITCSQACKSAAVSGKNNPFWGKSHSEEAHALMVKQRRLHPPKGTGPKKGFKHTPEARQKMTEALKRRWSENRDKMLAQFPRPPLKPRELLRYRRNFTPLQRKTWKDQECSWCGETSKLILDHIIPIMCGGTNERKNAQTLCQPCNIWKMVYVDRKLFLAGLGQSVG